MGRHPAPLSPAALAEARRYLRGGRRTYAVRGAPPHPSYRDLARHLHALRLTPMVVHPAILWRALRRTP